jgi:molecular chaperone DnaK (HSP70)
LTEPTEGVFGIDLGTTYSVVGYIDPTGRAAVMRNAEGSDTTPSVVFFESADNVVVGLVAKDAADQDPDNVVSLIKREMGSRDWKRTFHGVEHTPESISAIILQALAQSAYEDTGREVKQAVITVPAYFGLLETAATRQAGEIAGLEVIGIVPEPVAAALQYGISGTADGKTVLVYDLGGGTFDVSIISITEDEIAVLHTDGDYSLGGADWDKILYEHFVEETVSQTGDDSVRDDQELLQGILGEAEKVKKALSSAMRKTVVFRAGGAAAKITVTREQFEAMTADKLNETVRVTERALKQAEDRIPGIRDRISDVLLVGGSSRMPAVARALKAEFGWDAQLNDPDLAVAKGAALYAAGQTVRWAGGDDPKQGTGQDQPGGALEPVRADVIRIMSERIGVDEDQLESISKRTLVNVIPKAIGLKLVDTTLPGWEDDPEAAYVQHLVDAQTQLPFTAPPFVARTVVAGQEEIAIELYEQAGAVADRTLSANTRIDHTGSAITGIGDFKLPQGSPIEIDFQVSEEGTVTLRAVEPTSGCSADVRVQMSVRSDEEVQAAKKVQLGLTISTT